jgi:hypothetical protein
MSAFLIECFFISFQVFRPTFFSKEASLLRSPSPRSRLSLSSSFLVFSLFAVFFMFSRACALLYKKNQNKKSRKKWFRRRRKNKKTEKRKSFSLSLSLVLSRFLSSTFVAPA